MSITIFELRKKLARLSEIEDEKAEVELENNGAITEKRLQDLEWEYNYIGNEMIETPAEYDGG